MRKGGKDIAFFRIFYLPSNGVLRNQCPKTPKKMNTEQIRKRKVEKPWTRINGCSFMIPKEAQGARQMVLGDVDDATFAFSAFFAYVFG